MESVRCLLNGDGFLAPLLKKVELYDAANPLPLNRIRGAYFGIAAIGRGRSGICQSGIIAEPLSGFIVSCRRQSVKVGNGAGERLVRRRMVGHFTIE